MRIICLQYPVYWNTGLLDYWTTGLLKSKKPTIRITELRAFVLSVN